MDVKELIAALKAASPHELKEIAEILLVPRMPPPVSMTISSLDDLLAGNGFQMAKGPLIVTTEDENRRPLVFEKIRLPEDDITEEPEPPPVKFREWL